jgi:hypothetical protein
MKVRANSLEMRGGVWNNLEVPSCDPASQRMQPENAMNRAGFLCIVSVVRLLMVCAVSWLLGTTTAHAVTQGEWVSTGSPNDNAGFLIVLADGTPLLFGTGAVLVQQYQPETGTWAMRGTLPNVPFDTATLLSSGRILLTGASTTAVVYNPTLDVSSLTGPMGVGRSGAAATLLASGKVLVSGGRDQNAALLSSAEIYDPATGLWASTGGLNQPRSGQASIRLANGKVLVAGGEGVSGALASAEIYDPGTGIWTPTSVMDRPSASAKAVTLNDGRILFAGIGGSSLYDSGSNTWSPSVSIPAFGTSTNQSIKGLTILQDGTPLVLLTTQSRV